MRLSLLGFYDNEPILSLGGITHEDLFCFGDVSWIGNYDKDILNWHPLLPVWLVNYFDLKPTCSDQLVNADR